MRAGEGPWAKEITTQEITVGDGEVIDGHREGRVDATTIVAAGFARLVGGHRAVRKGRELARIKDAAAKPGDVAVNRLVVIHGAVSHPHGAGVEDTAPLASDGIRLTNDDRLLRLIPRNGAVGHRERELGTVVDPTAESEGDVLRDRAICHCHGEVRRLI